MAMSGAQIEEKKAENKYHVRSHTFLSHIWLQDMQSMRMEQNIFKEGLE